MKTSHTLLSGLVSLTLTTTAFSAVIVLDQKNQVDSPIDSISGAVANNSQSVAQSFTVGVTGRLESIAPLIGRGSPPYLSSGPLAMSIQTLDTFGFPSGTILGSATVAMTDIPIGRSSPSFDLSSSDIYVTSGMMLAFVLSSPADSPYNLHQIVNNNIDLSDGYTGGAALIRTSPEDDWRLLNPPAGTADWGFATFVNTSVPEPFCSFYLISGASLVLLRRRRTARGAASKALHD